MDYALFAVILLQFIYIVYRERANSQEREKLELKLMSKTVTEYKTVTGKEPEDASPVEESPYIPAEEATLGEILKARDKS